jgi:hypothetical protein
MKTKAPQNPERTYGVRIDTHPDVQKAVKIEQNNRHKAVKYIGPEPLRADILAEWLEEKAAIVIESDSE